MYHTYTCIYIYVHTYIYIYIHRTDTYLTSTSCKSASIPPPRLQGEERGALLRPGRRLGRRQRRSAGGVAAGGGGAPGESAELLGGDEADAEVAVTKLKSFGILLGNYYPQNSWEYYWNYWEYYWNYWEYYWNYWGI